MKYFAIFHAYDFRTEITRERYYSLRRRKGAREIIGYTNGVCTSRTLKFYLYV